MRVCVCVCVCACIHACVHECRHDCTSIYSMHEAWSGENRYRVFTGRSEDNLEATSSSDDTQDMDISSKHLYA